MCGDRARRRRRQLWSPSCARWARSRPGSPSVRLAVTTAIHCACAWICPVIQPALSRACRCGSILDLTQQEQSSMSDTPAQLGPWLALAGLGLFHGINPAMGWLFAVALGLHRHSQNVVFLSLIPIVVGHALAVTAVLVVVLALGLVFHWAILGRVAGIVLIGWAIWHALYGHRRRVRIGMQTGMAGL